MHWNWLNIGALMNFLTAIVLGGFVYFKNKKAAVNRTFALMSLFVAVWAGAETIFWGLDDKNSLLLFLGSLNNQSALFISVTYLHFTLELLGEAKRKRKLLITCYLLNFIVLILSFIFPMAFLGGARHKIPSLPSVFYPDKPGLLYYIYTLIFIVYANYAMLKLFQGLKVYSGIKRQQIKFNLIAALIGFSGGGTTFFLVYDIPIPPYPNVLMSVWTIILGFAIIRYRAFDIETVVHRTILWLFTSSLILVPVGTLLYFTRSWLNRLNLIQLTFITTGLFYLYLYYYHKIQPRIDHLFRRRKYDYQTILGKVAERIATTISIEDLTKALLSEIGEAMYLRNSLLYVRTKDGAKYSLLGRRGYQEVEGVRQQTATEIYPTDEERSHLPIAWQEISSEKDPFSSWLVRHIDVLDREQVEIDPQYENVRQQILIFFRERDIEVMVPLIVKDQVNAMLGLGKKENLQAYTEKDLKLLKKLGQEAGITVFNALHYEQLAETERLEDEMKMGRGIQMSLLPSQTPKIQGLSLQGLMEPAKEIGGDYYDFITSPGKEELAVVIGDVSGKGVAAGLLMSMVKASILTLSEEVVSPKELLMRLNRMLYRSVGSQKFMTLLYLLWQPETQTLVYSSAGHEHILIYRAHSDSVETIQSGGFMLGMILDIDVYLEEKQLKLQYGDKILLYTDGVTEALDAAGGRFGLGKLKESFNRHGQEPARELIQAIRDEVYGFIGSHPQYDDITLVVLEAV